MSEDVQLPTMLVRTDHAEFRLRVHAAAWSDQCGGTPAGYSVERPGLILLSATAADTSVKAARATLYSPDIAVEFELRQTTEYGYESVSRLTRSRCDGKPTGYTAQVAKLASGAVHLVALAKIPGLLPDIGDDHLWAELSGPRYTTPILRSWVGRIKRSLLESGGIVMAEGWQSNCGVLQVESDVLDNLVSDGIRSGYLKMQA